MRFLFLALLLTGCGTVRPTVGLCDLPDPALAQMGQSPGSLHELVKSACAMIGVRWAPKP